MSYIEISDDKFDEFIESQNIPIVVDFWAPWCGPCKILWPVFEKLSNEYEWKLKFVKINVDENPQAAIKYMVQWIPNLVLIKDKKAIKNIVWVKDEDEYKKEFDLLLWIKNNMEKQWIIDINWMESFKKELQNNSDKLVVADFWAPWCGPCKILAPTLEKIAEEFDWKVQVLKINVDNSENQELAQEFQVSSIPTLAFLKANEDPEISTGALPYEQLKDLIEKKI